MRTDQIAMVSFTLTSDEPISISDPERGSLRDRVDQSLGMTNDRAVVTVPVARRPATGTGAVGDPIVRGTAVFGPLRAHLATFDLLSDSPLVLEQIDSRTDHSTRTRQANLADLLCGAEAEECDEDGQPTLRPSALRVVETRLASSPVSTARTRVAIDRFRGAAVANKLFSREELSEVTIEVLVQVDLVILALAIDQISANCSTEDVLSDFTAVLHRWAPRVGGLVSGGRGTLSLTELRVSQGGPIKFADLFASTTTLAFFRATLAAKPPAAVDLAMCAPQDHAGSWSFRLAFTCADPLLIDPFPVGGDQQKTNVYKSSDTIPGSAWRGVLRSRCEFILRSCGVPACASTQSTCGRCPTCILFGGVEDTGLILGEGDVRRRSASGLVRFKDARVTHPHGVVLKIKLTHAPIDRFTGGAANGKLFAYHAHPSGSETTLHIEQMHATRPVPRWGRVLLGLAIRDLADGYVGIGHATTRGYGTLSVADPGLDALESGSDWLDDVVQLFPEVVA